MNDLDKTLEQAAQKKFKFPIEHQRLKLMVDKLYDQAARGCIESTMHEDFIVKVKGMIDAGMPFSEKQKKYVEDLFEKY